MDEQDPSLNCITEWLTAKDDALAKASADVMPVLERLVVQELVGGHNDEVSLSGELLGRFDQDAEARWLLVGSLSAWWRKKCIRDDKVDARRFVLRCADQVAMLLTFKNFKAVARLAALTLDGILLHRTVLGIYRSVKRAGKPTEEELSLCNDAMLRVADKFEFQCLGAAISYFKRAVWRRLFRGKASKSVSATHRLHEEQTPAGSEDDATDAGTELDEEGGVETLSDPEALAADFDGGRQRAWEELKRKLKPEHALRFCVLFVLFENGKGREWEEIADLVRQKGWCDVLEDRCPPGVRAEVVEAAFKAWAKRSAALSAANLRQAYCRYRKALRG